MGIRKYYWKVKDFISDSKRKPISVIASRDGRLFEVRDLFIGRFAAPAHDIHELDEIKSGFEYKLDKIPGYYLEQIISFFRDYCEKYEAEVLIHIYMDTALNEYILECPEQFVNKSFVRGNPNPLDPRRYKKVLEIHSHNTMEAYFSPTDNFDEINPLIYGVVGRLDKSPTLLFRVGLNGYYQELPATHLFADFNINNHIPYPKEWNDRVVVKER